MVGSIPIRLRHPTDATPVVDKDAKLGEVQGRVKGKSYDRETGFRSFRFERRVIRLSGVPADLDVFRQRGLRNL